MKLSQKKTCNRCTALGNTPYKTCKLGFKTKRVGSLNTQRNIKNTDRDYRHFANEHRPIEPCPKPLTIGTYIEFSKEIS